jgi:polyphosphate glucokinase
MAESIVERAGQGRQRAGISRERTETEAAGPATLCVDIGGTNIKATVLDANATSLAERVRRPTPKPANPDSVLDAIAELAAELPAFARISVGFPGVVKGPVVFTAPNLGTKYWAKFNLAEALRARFGVPARLLNDAAVHGLGVVEGTGLACMLTFGTGMGCALFRHRRFLTSLELGQHRARKGESYDQYVGNAALLAKGPRSWNRRVEKAVAAVIELTTCDLLYVGGGNARKITCELPDCVTIVSNTAGLAGGVRLWEREFDELFGRPFAAEPAL